ncbi:hypothetical protein RA2_00506 [Roseovarius sp. A-2]|uniref:hypothetical protein n=1 Tax=Roseovarius sp. A-2 TaxID=1570360 RepID=UPI0009D26694|nr:hypothetical protein [Roseovarius sp. A-2]GAW33469.1 hypothetical protein RA2_00506 [Roseovarius sp. A-2]
MRELIVYSCYVFGVLSLTSAAWLLTNELYLASLYLFMSSIGVFSVGFICDKLAGIEMALNDAASPQQPKFNNKELPTDANSEPRFEDGMAVIDTAEGPKRFANMTEAKKYLAERSA